MRFENAKVLITGCGGMLGNAIYPYFLDSCGEVYASDKVISELWLHDLDVRNYDKVKEVFESFQPDLVLHLAAETDLEFCETNPQTAEDTNSLATKYIAELSRQNDCTLVYISTAGVFDGVKEGFYTEADQPKPLMVYGQTKYDGELHVREICKKYYILRAGWMVGGGVAKDHKFTQKILEQILDNKKILNVVNDKWGTPTYTHDFAMNLFKLLDTEQYGTYHMVCEGSGTRYDVAEEILKICGRDDIEMKAVDSDFFKEEYFAPRPRSEMMKNVKLEALGVNLMRPWQEALSEYIQREFSHAIKNKEMLLQFDMDDYSREEHRLRRFDRRMHKMDQYVDEQRKGNDRRTA